MGTPTPHIYERHPRVGDLEGFGERADQLRGGGSSYSQKLLINFPFPDCLASRMLNVFPKEKKKNPVVQQKMSQGPGLLDYLYIWQVEENTFKCCCGFDLLSPTLLLNYKVEVKK